MWFRKKAPATEDRSGVVDVGAIYQSFYQFGGSAYSWQVSPAVLAGSLTIDGMGVLLEHSRRLARQSPLAISYRRCMTGGVLTGEPESPTFPEGIPDAVVATVTDLWLAAHPVDMERDALARLIIDGDCLILDDGAIVPCDAFEAVTSGPKWAPRVSGYKIGKGARVRRAGVLYLGDRSPGDTRAAPWQAAALPYLTGLLNTRVGASHALGVMAKIAATVENATAERTAAAVGARSSVAGAVPLETDRQPLHSVGVGSVPFLRHGEKIGRPMAGPDKQAMDYESVLEGEAAAAFNLPLSELKSDYSSGSFSNLRMAWQDADREYERRRKWFHRHFRMPVFRELLSDALADGTLAGITPDIWRLLEAATWAGPRREPPQPEKEWQAIAALGKAGLTVPDANAQLEGT